MNRMSFQTGDRVMWGGHVATVLATASDQVWVEINRGARDERKVVFNSTLSALQKPAIFPCGLDRWETYVCMPDSRGNNLYWPGKFQ